MSVAKKEVNHDISNIMFCGRNPWSPKPGRDSFPKRFLVSSMFSEIRSFPEVSAKPPRHHPPKPPQIWETNPRGLFGHRLASQSPWDFFVGPIFWDPRDDCDIMSKLIGLVNVGIIYHTWIIIYLHIYIYRINKICDSV